MYIQMCVKGIAGRDETHPVGVSWDEAQGLVRDRTGILSNWWRVRGQIRPCEVADVLNERNLDRHLHDYAVFGNETPFISLAAGAVERDTLLRRNFQYDARDTALAFATEDWSRPGALFYCWVPTSLNRAVPLGFVAEAVRDLLVYRAWSPWQLEGEITAKVHIPSNQIQRVEWWDGSVDRQAPQFTLENDNYVAPALVTNLRDLF